MLKQTLIEDFLNSSKILPDAPQAHAEAQMKNLIFSRQTLQEVPLWGPLVRLKWKLVRKKILQKRSYGMDAAKIGSVVAGGFADLTRS